MAGFDPEDLFGSLFGGKTPPGGDDENPMVDPNHPAVKRLMEELLSSRSAMIEALKKEVGDDEALDILNPEGIICGLVDRMVVSFTTSPIATLLILSDKMTSAVRMDEGKPGKYLHQLGHILFDLGRTYELELQKRGSEAVTEADTHEQEVKLDETIWKLGDDDVGGDLNSSPTITDL